MKKRKRRTEEEMIEDYLRKSVNRSIKVVYENMHKAHLLCLLAHGQFLNQTLNSGDLLGSALSIVTDKNAYPPKRLDLKYLQIFVAWFGRKVTRVSKELPEDYWSQELTKVLTGRFETKTAYTNRELVLMFVVLCRTLGINIRLVLAFQPVSWKPGTEVLLKKGKKVDEKDGNFKEDEKKSEIPQPSTSKTTFIKDKQGRKMISSESDVETPSKKTLKKKVMDKNTKRKNLSEDDDSDFELGLSKFRKGPKSTSSQKKVSAKRKSTEGEGKEGGKKKKGDPLVEWAEVYVEEEEKWVCVDILKGKIHCVAEIETRMPSGSAYITAFNVNLSVKDVSRRYIRSWLSSEKKLRYDSEWWGESIRGFRGIQSRLDKEEEKELNQNLKQQPLPTSMGEYKNHPLYALQRHLLKFEAIYPPDESPVGFIRGEPVYPRESIKNLHSRDTWMKEAKSVRVDEEPYKVVKARPKWDRNTNQVIKDRPLEVFGEWQVEDYEPPVAKDGKVPRNDYGNVELFKPTMLPRGCVHLPINGLNKVARKLDIDCAPAMVGFDFHSGWTHPVYEGYVVCEEFKDLLMDAWNEEQVEQARRAEEKRQKRIYDNWRRLIKGMIVRARVREDYYKDLSEEEEEEKKTEELAEEATEDMQTESKQATRKIKQADIDALRPEHNNPEEKTNESKNKTNEPDIKTSELNKNTDEAGPSKPRPLITHTIKNLKIDLSSNIVEMAKKSRQKTMRTKNTVKKPPAKKKQKEPAKEDVKKSLKKVEAGTLSEDSSETDEEVKKEKIRAILNWGTEAATANPELSDDSDAENTPQSSSSSFQPQLSNPFFASIINPALEKAKKVRKKRRTRTPTEPAEGESESEQSEASSSRSTTPEPDVGEADNAGTRRLSSRRMPRKKSVTYTESASDVSLDSSDCEDRSYNPEKEKCVTLVESASDISID